VSWSPTKLIVLTVAVLCGAAALLQCMLSCNPASSTSQTLPGPLNGISVLSDVYDSNLTLVVDGVTVTYENTRIVQAGNIRILNGGKLILTNTTLALVQLCSYQYGITVTGNSELILQSSNLDSDYPLTLTLVNSVISINRSSADQLVVMARGPSDITAISSSIKSLCAFENTRLTFESGPAESITISGLSRGSVSSADISSSSLFDASNVGFFFSRIDTLVLSDSANATVVGSTLGELHLWDEAMVSLSGCDVESLELYDSSKSAVSSSNFTDIVVRSSSHQEFISLRIEGLTCGGGSSTVLKSCTVGSADVWIADLDIYSTSLSRVSYGYMTRGIVNCSSIDSLESSFGALLWVLNCNATSIVCSRNSVTRLESSRIGLVDAWDFDGGNLTVQDSQIEDMWVRWDTILNMSGSVVSRYSMWDRAQAKLVSSNFTSEMHVAGDTRAFVFNASIERLYLYGDTNASFVRCSLNFGFSYAMCARILSDLPLGLVRFWNPVANGSIVGESYTAEFIDCIILGYTGVCKYDVDITIMRSQIRLIILGDRVRLVCNDSSFGEVQANNADASFSGLSLFYRCTITSLNCYGSHSQGQLTQCNVSSSVCGAWGNWVADRCSIGFLEVRDESSFCITRSTWNRLWVTGGQASFSHCSSDWGIWVTGYGRARFENCTLGGIHVDAYSEATMSNCTIGYLRCSVEARVRVSDGFKLTVVHEIYGNAQLTRLFDVAINFPNGSPCAFASYQVLSATNLTLLVGVSSQGGTCEFGLLFVSTNSSAFVSRCLLRASVTTYSGLMWFNVTASQPLLLVLQPDLPDGIALDTQLRRFMPRMTENIDACQTVKSPQDRRLGILPSASYCGGNQDLEDTYSIGLLTCLAILGLNKECVQIEPGLNRDHRFHNGLFRTRLDRRQRRR